MGWLRRRSADASRGYSLRRRLTATTVGAGMIAGLVSTAIVLFIAWHEVSDAYDDTLEEGARLVLALGEGALGGGASSLSRRMRDGDDAMLRLDYQIVSRDGVVLARGEDAPERPFVDPASRDDRFYDTRVDGERWRVYVRRHESLGFSVQIGQEWEDRNELVFDVLESLAWPLAALWGLLGLVNWWLVRRLTAPLVLVAKDIEGKSPSDLSPIPGDSRAMEVRAMVAALNRLLQRLSRALEGERRFTADAAHELRTPLAALASRIQVMQRSHASAGTPALATDMQRLRDDVGRATAMVENLLELARLDPESDRGLAVGQVELQGLIADVVRVCAPAAQARHVTVDAACGEHRVAAHRDALFSALRNLVDNAIRYGREGGRVRVAAEVAGGKVRIVVQDDGDGVTDGDLRQLTRRFFRVLGTESTGSGLGLSIASRVMELHGGELSFGPGLEGRGLGVTLAWPVVAVR